MHRRAPHRTHTHTNDVWDVVYAGMSRVPPCSASATKRHIEIASEWKSEAKT